MATIQTINVGAAPDDGNGDPLRTGMQKVNTNFAALNAESLGKTNLSATTNPAVSDDNTQGYQIGSIWINTSTDTAYQCLDASTGAAVWKETTQQDTNQTNLGYTASPTDGTVTSSTGTDATIPLATPTAGTNLAGLLAPSDKTKLDNTSGSNTGDQTASTVSNTPAGNISSTDVQGAINELDTEKQAISPILTSIGGTNLGADEILYTTSPNAYAGTSLTSFGRSLLDDADAATARTTLGLGALSTLNTVGTTEVDDDSVTNSKLSEMGPNTVKINNTSLTANPTDLTMGNSTVLGRTSASDIKAMTVAEVKTELGAGSADGLATLDSGGKVPASQLPNSVMNYLGTWNASTNTPTLADGVGSAGDVYRVSVAGSQDLGSGSISFDVGDYVIYSGTVWEKSDNTDAVTSVHGRTGVVVSANGDYTGSQITNVPSGTISSTTVQAAIDELESEKQAANSDLTSIAGLTPANDDIIQRKAGAWTNRTVAQYKADLSLGALADLNTVGTTEIDNDAVTLDKLASGTAGNLITYDASGNPAAVATGTSGQVLTSNGAGSAPTYQTYTPSLASGTVLGSATTMTANGTYQTTNHQVTVPNTGTYTISYQVIFNWTPIATSDGINVRIRNTTQSSTISGTINFMSAYNGTFNRQPTMSGTIHNVSLSAGDVIQIQCSTNSGITTFNTLQQVNAETYISYVQTA